MASLYDDGWRQGSIFSARLPLGAVVVGASGEPEPVNHSHSRWVVAAQDCDLAGADHTSAEPCIELRPVYTDSPPQDWGIRSARFLLTTGEYVVSSAPRLSVAPTVLTALVAGDIERHRPDPSRSQAFTTWLGLRYDRPAVPDHLVPLAQHVSEVVRHHERARAARVRDVLMQFDDTVTPVRVSLFAILANAQDEEEIRRWLAGIAQKIAPAFGLVDRLEAATADGIAFSVIEESYAADVSQVTWRPAGPDPEGAT
jgi:hypothetical protein